MRLRLASRPQFLVTGWVASLLALSLVACSSADTMPASGQDTDSVATAGPGETRGGVSAANDLESGNGDVVVRTPDSERPTTATGGGSGDVMPSAAPGSDAVVRALYVNRFAAQSTRKFAQLLAIADSTEVNALVIDMKDEFGLNFNSDDPEVQRNAGTMGKVRDVRVLIDSVRAHGLLPIARLVVFKDSVAARMNSDQVIRKADGTPWRDKQGLTWVSPYSQKIRDYNIKAAEELVRLGFAEIQWDYIRFPEPYKSLPTQHFPGSNGVSKPDALADFLKQAQSRMHALGVRSTADIFGLVTTVDGPLEIGQHWEKVAPVSDVLLPMVYPSHYPAGSFGIARPNAEPYQIVFKAISRAHERNAALGLNGQHVRPYLQAFTLGKPEYGAEQVREQIRAVNDAGYQGWVLWHPGSSYLPFVDAIRR